MPTPTITVKAAPGARIPKPGPRRRFFTQEPEKVKKTSYVKRRLKDGGLVEVEPEKPAPSPKSSKPSSKPSKSEQ